MADVTTASVTSASGAAPLAVKPSTSKKTVKPRKPAPPAEHPKYSEMIASAISHLKERKGSSRQAILKYVLANYKVGTEVGKINARVKMALRAGIKNCNFRQVKGAGASGSFRLGEKAKSQTAKPKTIQKTKAAGKKPATKKASKTTAIKKKAGTPTKKKADLKKSKSANKQKKPSKLAGKIKAKVAHKSPAKKVVKKTMTKPKKMVKKSPAKKIGKAKVARK